MTKTAPQAFKIGVFDKALMALKNRFILARQVEDFANED